MRFVSGRSGGSQEFKLLLQPDFATSRDNVSTLHVGTFNALVLAALCHCF